MGDQKIMNTTKLRVFQICHEFMLDRSLGINSFHNLSESASEDRLKLLKKYINKFQEQKNNLMSSQSNLKKHGLCPNCSFNWDGGSIAEQLIQKKASGVSYLADKSEDLIHDIVKDDFGSEDARYSLLVVKDGGLKCPNCEHYFPQISFSADKSYPFFNSIKRKEN
jgi:hypothetical protein